MTFASLFLYWFMVAIVTFRVALKRRALGVSFAWLLIIYIIPFLGVVLYFLFGELNLGRKRAARAKAMFVYHQNWLAEAERSNVHQPENLSPLSRPVHDLCLQRTGIPALSGNHLALYQHADAILGQFLRDIQGATHSINMTFYIWHLGGEADNVAQAVCDAAKRGVTVRILLDAAGSKAFFKSHWPSQMRQAGIELIEALAVSPVRMFLRRLDLRQHRKMLIIDNQLAYTGSMNMVDPAFFKRNRGVGQWVDIMVAVQGPAVPILNNIFAWDWEVETGLRYSPALPSYPKADYRHAVQVAPSGPGMPDGIIQQVLLLTINQAQKRLTITTPYLVPSESLLHALQTTAQRGVEVNIIIPAKNDSLMVEWASRSFFSDLLDSGINIYRFNGGLLHSKSVMVDDNFCLIGTVNLDMRSLWLNFELTLCIDDKDFCAELITLQESYIADSELVDKARWARRSILTRPIELFFYMFSPLL